MTTFLIILATFWLTCGIIHIIQKSAKPFSVVFPLLDIVFSPYVLIEDARDEYKKWKEKGYFDK